MARFGPIGSADDALEPERIGAPGRPERSDPKQHGFALPLFQSKAQQPTLFVPASLRLYRTHRARKRSAFRRDRNLENTGTNRRFDARARRD
jgi:hypothetical protein